MPHFYSLTLQNASCVNKAVYGNFSSPKAQEVVVSRGTILELLRPDDLGNMQVVCSHEVFGLIRSMVPFRLVGAKRDYLIVSSDSGRVVILEFDNSLNVFVKVHQETYGRSGCRRVVAGEYLAVDPAGRACLIGAIEKQKFVYVLNRDMHQKLTISSPLEAHKAGTIVYDICGLDVGYANPLFASLEQDITNQRPVQYTIYEMDLGVNHVSRKFAEPVPDSASRLIAVPDIGGCLICLNGELMYKKLGQPTEQLVLPPQRTECLPGMVVAHATHKLKDFTLILIQTESGDLYRIDIVPTFRAIYFDSLPFRSVSICVLKTGFLFAAAESGNHALYQFNPEGGLLAKEIGEPRPTSSLIPISESSSLCPLTDMKAMDPLVETASGGACQVFALCGRGDRSTLRVLRQGLAVSELALSELPGKPSGLWTISLEAVTQFIVLSFVDVTLVLAVGDSVEEVSDSGFLANVPSLFCGRTEDGSLVQIHPGGVRLVGAKTSEWRASGVTVGTAKGSDILVALDSGDFVYLVVSDGLLLEKGRRNFGSEIRSVALGTHFAAVAGSDCAVRVISIEPGHKFMKQVSAQSYPVLATSTAITEGWLYIGLEDGTLVRCCLDPVTGGLSDARMRLLGARPVRLQPVGNDNVLALSSRPWWVTPNSAPRVLSYLETENQLPIVLELAAGFAAPDQTNGIVSVSQSTLRIISVDSTASNFCQASVPLSYTPRKLVLVPGVASANNSLFVNEHSMLAITEAEQTTSENPTQKNLWKSCVRIVDPVSLETKFRLEYDNNECVQALAVTYFYQLKDKRPCLVIASARDLTLRPTKSAKNCALKTYLYDSSFALQLVHTTAVEEPVLALCQYEGRMLASLVIDGKAIIRLYELGKKKLLLKSEYRNSVCGGFVSIQVNNDRIFAADIHNSIHVLKLNKADGQLCVVCDDTLPRYVSSMLVLDHNTVVGGDKFDNFFALSVPSEVKNTNMGEGLRLGPDTAYILGKNAKFDPVNSFHLGQTITAMQKVTMSSGSSEVILYSTLGGSLGALCPITSKKEYNLLLALESELRQEPTLVGRDHQAFRSFYLPSKGVIDGDLISQEFSRSTRKAEIAQKLGKSENELHKLIEEMLYRIT